MKLIHRKIDFDHDRDYILERHCRINYACDTPWARRTPYEQYRREWFTLTSQISEFYAYLQETAANPHTIAEIIETEDGRAIGYLWAPFHEDSETDFRFAELQEIYVEEEYRQRSIASELFRYVEEAARNSRAMVVRSGTGCENVASIRLHEKLGYYQYRLEFEKVL